MKVYIIGLIVILFLVGCADNSKIKIEDDKIYESHRIYEKSQESFKIGDYVRFCELIIEYNHIVQTIDCDVYVEDNKLSCLISKQQSNELEIECIDILGKLR